MSDSPRLEIPAGIEVMEPPRARRCHATWLVHCSAAERDALQARSWPGATRRLDDAPLFHARTLRGQPGWEVATVGGFPAPGPSGLGRCAFLEPNSACEVAQAGAESVLPAVCRRQPFRFVRCPDREELTVGVDWSCPEVTAARGRPLQRRREELESLAALDGAVRGAPLVVPLDARRSFEGWDVFREAEETTLALLESTRVPLTVAVAATVAIPRLAAQFLGAMARIPGGLAAYPLRRYFQDQRVATKQQDAFYAQVGDVASLIPDRLRGRRFLANTVTVLTAAATGRSRLAVSLELYGHRARNRRGADELRWALLPAPGLSAQLDQVAFPIERPELSELLRAYLAHVVRRRLLLPFAGLERGCAMLAVLFGLAREVSRALALDARAPTVDAGHLRAAVARIDALALDENVQTLLASPSPLRGTLDRLLRPRDFAVSLIRPLDPAGQGAR